MVLNVSTHAEPKIREGNKGCFKAQVQGGPNTFFFIIKKKSELYSRVEQRRKIMELYSTIATKILS